ncbi:MAG: DUF2339 domain-containing protein, partial [Rhodospirillaceae bacterium]|nr:DUF2339 domain-containing protein [Rhodospirillaceae bacterium]
DVESDRRVGQAVAAIALVLAFAYVSFEVRHWFDPNFERDGFGAEGIELYVYSIVWLLFGVGLLALGFLRNAPPLRHAGMVLVCIVVAKVFLIGHGGAARPATRAVVPRAGGRFDGARLCVSAFCLRSADQIRVGYEYAPVS